MWLIIFCAVVITVWAALINIDASFHPPDEARFVAAVILTLAVSIQRVNGIQKWLSSPMNRRKQNVEEVAQQTLINLCKDQPISRDLLDLRVHVWEVPLWYRKLFPYVLRTALKRLAMRMSPNHATKLTLRPTLRRIAAIGLLKQPPSGVRFRKGLGLIGVCIANNDRAEYVTLDITDEQRREALHSASENEWLSYGPEITHNLKLTDAQKLSHSYGQVISLVVQNLDTGEAIGCVTISAKRCTLAVLNVATSESVRENITTLALSVARLIA
jgi:hypothetical protein